jgi:hypothetical protein
MSAGIFIPSSMHEAAQHLRASWRSPLASLPKSDFIRAWSAVAYLFPELHPDGYDDPDSGWPRALKIFAAEAWRRVEAGELEDEHLYASDAQWAGLYDRMTVHTRDETARRKGLAANSGIKIGF